MPSMNRRTYVKMIGTTASLTGLAGCLGGGGGSGQSGGGGGSGQSGGGGSQSQQTELTSATAAEGTGSATFANAAARMADQYSDTFSISVTNYPGTRAIMEVFGAGEHDLMTADSVNAVLAANELAPLDGADYSGENALENKPTQVFSLFPIWYYWVTLEEYGFETLEDAAGETFGMGEAGSAPVFRLRLEEAGFTDYEYETMDFTEHPGALREGRVAAIPHYMLPPAISPGWAEELVSMDGLQILPYSEQQQQNLVDSPLIQVEEVDVSEVYESEVAGSKNVASSASYIYYCANAEVSDDVVYEVCNVLFSNLQEVKDFHVLLEAAFGPEGSIQGLSEEIPVHPGAARWYQDNDHWNDNLEVA